MELKLSQRLQRSRPEGDRTGLHRFSDGLLHSALMAAIIAMATIAVVQALEVGVTMWTLEPVVIQGKAQPVPLPSAPGQPAPTR